MANIKKLITKQLLYNARRFFLQVTNSYFSDSTGIG